VDNDVLRARLEASCGGYGAARALLEEIIRRAPQALSPRVALCDVLLQQGTDWAAAEQALRAVLAIAPNYAVCRKNLDSAAATTASAGGEVKRYPMSLKRG
jgi:hypothetical protein